MKFAAAILLGLLAVCAVQGKSLSPWEKKVKDLEVRFEKAVDHKAEKIIEKIKNTVHYVQEHSEEFVEELEREINATVAAALKEIEVLKLDVNLECYKNATQDVVAAQEAAITNLMGCKNLSTAYQDIQLIAQNATVVVMDVVKDAKLIIEGVAECGTDIGVAKLKCVVKYVAAELKNLVSQWPDAKAFITVAKALGSDAAHQVNTCLNDPTQQSLEKKVEQALTEFSACSQKSVSQFDLYVM